jgi:enamine deaminase RidA (YjgF/YER057c/UK114 family)
MTVSQQHVHIMCSAQAPSAAAATAAAAAADGIGGAGGGVIAPAPAPAAAAAAAAAAGFSAEDTAAALEAALLAISSQLEALQGITSWQLSCFVHLYLADMAHFGVANAAYCRHLPQVNPPSRACVQVSAQSPYPAMTTAGMQEQHGRRLVGLVAQLAPKNFAQCTWQQQNACAASAVVLAELLRRCP